jgi:hypothetical protein
MSAGEAANQPDAEDRKKEQGWRTFFSLTNPNLWIFVAVITAVIALVDLPSHIYPSAPFVSKYSALPRCQSPLTCLSLQGWYCGNAIFSIFTEAKSWFLDELPYSLVIYYLVFCFCAMVLIPYGPFCIAIGYIFGLGEHECRWSNPPLQGYCVDRVGRR